MCFADICLGALSLKLGQSRTNGGVWSPAHRAPGACFLLERWLASSCNSRVTVELAFSGVAGGSAGATEDQTAAEAESSSGTFLD